MLPPAVHPRSCGEQTVIIALVAVEFGSSPLVRGTGRASSYFLSRWRFIPARAGNRSRRPPTVSTITVHPRSCGEQVQSAMSTGDAAGSSPLVRGTDDSPETGTEGFRFIPARAGNRIRSDWQHDSDPVHPRSCGEQKAGRINSEAILGSSPLVRGTDSRARSPGTSFRFIPARAGNRKLEYRAGFTSAVHPRSCGEQGHGDQRAEGFLGSSPLVRGTVEVVDGHVQGTRFIPARAGNSWIMIL